MGAIFVLAKGAVGPRVLGAAVRGGLGQVGLGPQVQTLAVAGHLVRVRLRVRVSQD